MSHEDKKFSDIVEKASKALEENLKYCNNHYDELVSEGARSYSNTVCKTIPCKWHPEPRRSLKQNSCQNCGSKSMKNHSYVVLESTKVRDLCVATITDIQRIRQEKLDEWAEERIEESRRSWFRRLFKLPIKTREEVEIVPLDRWSDPRHDVKYLHGNQYKTAEKLLEASKHAEKISVTVDDLNMIT